MVARNTESVEANTKLNFQSLESGFSLEVILARGLAFSVGGVPFIAGVPSPDRGLTKPLGGTGMRISSGEPGIIEGLRSGTWIRLASF